MNEIVIFKYKEPLLYIENLKLKVLIFYKYKNKNVNLIIFRIKYY